MKVQYKQSVREVLDSIIDADTCSEIDFISVNDYEYSSLIDDLVINEPERANILSYSKTYRNIKIHIIKL